MNDRVQVGQRLLVAEDPLGESSAIEMSAVEQDLAAESFDHQPQNVLPRLLQLPHDDVGIDHHGAVRGQLRRHHRLPRTDPARETDEDHVVTSRSC